MKRIIAVLISLFTLIFIFSCSDNPAGPVIVDKDITLSVGQTVTIEPVNLKITLLEVAESRCPMNAYCFWEGMGETHLMIETAAGSNTYRSWHTKSHERTEYMVYTGGYYYFYKPRINARFKFDDFSGDTPPFAELLEIENYETTETVTLRYDASERLTRITAPSSRYISLEWDTSNTLMTVLTTPDTNDITYGYDASGYLTRASGSFSAPRV